MVQFLSMDDEAAILREAHRVLNAGETLSPTLQAQIDAVFAAHRPRLLRITRSWVRDDARAEEITQETLIIGWPPVSGRSPRGQGAGRGQLCA